MPDEQLTIGELAATVGVATSALRYWEELGLLPTPDRVSGKRRYPTSAVPLVGLILLLREVGFTLHEIKTLVPARTNRSGTWREPYQRKLAELDERIAQAQVARTALEHGLACKHEDIFDCPTFAKVLAARLAGAPLREAHNHQ